MSTAGDALITVRGRELRLEAPYDAVFIAELKKLIPGRDRRWDSDEKVWIVHKMFKRQLIELCEAHYDSVDVEEEPEPKVKKPAGPTKEDDAIRAYGNIIRFVTDETLHEIVALARLDRDRDPEALETIGDALTQVMAYRERTGQTG